MASILAHFEAAGRGIRARATRTLAPLVLVGFSACDADPPNTPLAATRFALEELWTIDGHAEALVPFQPSVGEGSLAIMPDGSIAATQSQLSQIRFFTSDGVPSETFGRSGSGPGEFSTVVRIGRVGDALWAYDSRARRATVISSSLSLISTVNVPREVAPNERTVRSVPPATNFAPRALLADGSLIGITRPDYDPTLPPALQNRDFLARVDSSGQILDVLQAIRWEGTVARDGSGMVYAPFTNREQIGVSADGSLFAFASADLQPAEPSIRVVLGHIGSGVLFDRTYPIEVTRIPEAIRDSAFRSEIDAAGEAAASVLRERLGETEFYPPLRDLLVSTDSTVWLKVDRNDGLTSYVVLDGRGETIGEVQLAANQRVALARRDYLLVLTRDALDVEGLTAYRLRSRE